MQFFLPMIPPAVTHQDKQLRAYLQDGKPKAVLHDSSRLKAARAKLTAHLAGYRPETPMTGAVQLVVKWCFPCGNHPSGAYKTTRPDTDNLEKLLKDVMTDLHFWKDDAQVASEVVEKFWSDIPGIFIAVKELES